MVLGRDSHVCYHAAASISGVYEESAAYGHQRSYRDFTQCFENTQEGLK